MPRLLASRALPVAAFVLVAGSFLSHAGAAGTRADVPIALEVQRDGKHVWSISVLYGATSVKSVLDTGSIPPQLLPGHAEDSVFTSTGRRYHIGYGFGGVYDGDVMTGRVGVGARSGTIDFGLVRRAQCAKDKPRCPIAGEDVSQARFGGNKFDSIVGAALHRGDVFAPAFEQLGVRRFIITAPRDEDGERTGRLVLEPSPDETRGYARLPISNASGVTADSVRGCLVNRTRRIEFCGNIVFDTGKTGITVSQARNRSRLRNWHRGDAAVLQLKNAHGGDVARVDFTVGDGPALQVGFGPPGRHDEPLIGVGQLPYLGLHVLTDYEQGNYAVAPRPPQHIGNVVGHVP